MRSLKTEIRASVRKLLLDKTEAVKNVFASRVAPSWNESLPVINIFTTSETLELFSNAPKRYQRALNLVVEVAATGNTPEEIDENLDSIGERVEALMELDETLGLDCVSKTTLVNVEYDYEGEGGSNVGSIILNYEVIYYTYAIRDGLTCLDDFKTVAVDYKVGHHNESPDEIVESKSLFELEQN